MAGWVNMPRENTRIPFLNKVIQSNTTECIEWPFAKRKGTPYGHFSIWFENKQYNFYAHNYICRLIYGPAPEGFEAAHRCGNPICVNPKHLRWATHCENMQDAIEHAKMRSNACGRETFNRSMG